MAVVLDVLRATSVMVRALSSGCEAVIPCLEIADATATATAMPEGSVILAGERGGLPIEGFDLGNSPRDFEPDFCEGKTVVMTTTNGTRAILASLQAERVLIASFLNLSATVDEIAVQVLKKDHGHPVHIVCSGTDGFVSLEDSLLAGALVEKTQNALGQSRGLTMGNDEATIAFLQWVGARASCEEPGNPLGRGSLESWLATGRGGQNVRRIGRALDILDAAEIDACPLVAELVRDPLRIVKV